MSRRAAWLRAPQWSSWTATLRWSFGASWKKHGVTNCDGCEVKITENNWKNPWKTHEKPHKTYEIHWDTLRYHILSWFPCLVPQIVAMRLQISSMRGDLTNDSRWHPPDGPATYCRGWIKLYIPSRRKNRGKMLVDGRFSWSKWMKMIYFMTLWQCFLWFSGFVRWYHWVSGMVQGPGCILSLIVVDAWFSMSFNSSISGQPPCPSDILCAF